MESMPLQPRRRPVTHRWGVLRGALLLIAGAAMVAYTSRAGPQSRVPRRDANLARLTGETARRSPSSPHIFFVFVDDMGANDVGYQSADLRGLTPTLDALAADGVTLRAYYSMHMCTPARAALYTARYPSTIGMQYENIKPDQPWGLPLDQTLLPALLKRHAGYRTHLVGKWNQGFGASVELPTRRGFDSFFGYLSDEVNYYKHTYPSPFAVSEKVRAATPRMLEAEAPLGGAPPPPPAGPAAASGVYMKDMAYATNASGELEFFDDAADTFTSTLYTARARELVREHAASFARAGAPLFLLYAAQTVHGPLDTPPRALLSAAQWAQLDGFASARRRTFGALAAALDGSVGAIKAELELGALWNDTVLVFASDNGGCLAEGGSNAPFRGGKHFLFEGGVRVPAFVHSPLLPDAAKGATRDMLFLSLIHI